PARGHQPGAAAIELLGEGLRQQRRRRLDPAGDRRREPIEHAAPRVVQGVRRHGRLVERGRMAGKSLEDCGHLRLSPFPVFPALETVYKRLSERQREAFSPWRNSSATCWWWAAAMPR